MVFGRKDLRQLGLVDAIIPEPVGGAHRNVHDTVYNVETFIARTLAQLKRSGVDDLLEARYRKWRSVGQEATTLGISHTLLRLSLATFGGLR